MCWPRFRKNPPSTVERENSQLKIISSQIALRLVLGYQTKVSCEKLYWTRNDYNVHNMLHCTTRKTYKRLHKLWFNYNPDRGITCQQISQFWKLCKKEEVRREESALYTHTVRYTWLEGPENSPKLFYHYVSLVSLHSLVSQTISFSSFR